MSPVMIAPLVVLAALLVFPGRMPAERGAAAPPPAVVASVATDATFPRRVVAVLRFVGVVVGGSVSGAIASGALDGP